MALTLTLNADNTDDLIRMLNALNRAFGAPPGQVSDKIASIDFNAVPGAGTLTANVALAQPTEPPPPKAAEVPQHQGTIVPAQAVNVAVPPDGMTPAEMRKKGTELLMQYFNRDPAAAQLLLTIQQRFGVKKFDAVPDDRAQEFYTEAVLIANGTGAVAAS